MPSIRQAISELHEMDELWQQESFAHRLHPLSKLILVIIYILLTLSFPKYNLSGLWAMGLFPILMLSSNGIGLKTCFNKMKIALPLVCAVGLLNPLFDKKIIIYMCGIPISGGVVSMVTLMLKGVFCVMASFVLIATTSIYDICGALSKIHIPNIFVTLILLTYRYMEVMMEEVDIMTTAYKLRAPGQKGIHISAWGSFVGQLLLRSLDKASDIYISMKLRARNGEFRYGDIKIWDIKDTISCLVGLICLFFFRFFNISVLLGQLFT